MHCDRFDVSEGIDVDKASASRECDIYHYWFFLNYSFKFQQNVCNRYHDLLMMSVNLSHIAILNIKASDYRCIISFIHIAILNIKGSDYRCIISFISKKEAINLIQNDDLTEKSGTL